MKEDKLTLAILSIVLLALFSFISLTPPAVYQATVPCKWMSNKVLFGGRVDYYCYLSITPSSGTHSYYLYYPGNVTNLKYAKIGIFDVQTPIEYINITGSLPPDTTERISVTIPEGAYDIAIYGTIIGRDIDGDFPDYPYIKGGNYDLLCDIECKYNKGLIIDKPGTYTLEVYSGRGGYGIDYIISGSYKLPSPSLEITYDDNILLSISNVNYVIVQDVTDKIDKPSGYLIISIEGKPQFRLVFESKMTCSLTGSEWNCNAYYERGTNQSTIICIREIISTCNFKGIIAEIPLDLPGPYYHYFTEASDATLEVATKIIDVQPGSLSVLISDMPQGQYYIKLLFTVPYLVPEARESHGQCVFERTHIEVYGEPGKTGSFTFSIYNIGDTDILVRMEPSDEIAEYLSITPYQQIIPAKSSKPFTIDIALPEVPTEIAGYIIVQGCAEQPVKIPVRISTIYVKLWFVEYLPSIIIVSFSSLILFLLRPYFERYLGRTFSYIVIIGIILLLILIVFILYPIKLNI